jgi:hypothetical protein
VKCQPFEAFARIAASSGTAALIAITGPASAAPQKLPPPYPGPGTAFESISDGLRSYVRRSPSGDRLTAYLLQWRVPCSDGSTLRTGLHQYGERRVSVGEDGSFAYETRVQRYVGRYKGRAERFRYQAGFTGSFAGDGQSVNGIAHVRVFSRRRTCKAPGHPVHGVPSRPTGGTGPDRSTSHGLLRAGRRARVRPAT